MARANLTTAAADLPHGPAAAIVGVAGVEPAHRDEAEPKVADFGQQPVQRGLIGERAGDDRLRAVAAEVETLEPGTPMAVEDTVDADLVTRGLSGGAHWCTISLSGSLACALGERVRVHPWSPP